jgi:hypothetical protein
MSEPHVAPVAGRRGGLDGPALAGWLGAVLWAVFCLLWFDVAAPWRPAALANVPPLAVLGTALLATGGWLRGRRRTLWGEALGSATGPLVLVLALAFFFRLPVVAAGAATAVTSDGALSGIVALHVAHGGARDVFVPHVPYSGSLKSHLTAALTLVMDPARAFALASVLFYLGYVAGLFRLALLVAGPRAALLAGLYAAFSPPFLTRYSLSNDGNYVEVLALGTWALWLAARWTRERDSRGALAAGLLLGLAFWCHILAVIHAAAIGALFVAVAVIPGRSELDGRRRIRNRDLLSSARSLVALGAGWAIGYLPGLLWNAANDWASFQYLLPGERRPGEGAEAGVPVHGLLEKARLMVADHWPVLMGYDGGYGRTIDTVLLAVAWVGVVAALFALGWAARRAWRERSRPLAALLLFAAANVAIALAALPHVPGNPRYLLFLMSVVPVVLADAFGRGRLWRPSAPGGGWQRPLVLVVLIGTGAVASFAQVPPTIRQDGRWREFVGDMEREGVRFCYTDFYLATRVNFLSGERIVCSAKLGPTTTEYFFEYRERVEAAPEAAFVAVNRTSASRLERRLQEIGVTYEREELLKPVLLRLSRKVDPEELFPGREFPIR